MIATMLGLILALLLLLVFLAVVILSQLVEIAWRVECLRKYVDIHLTAAQADLDKLCTRLPRAFGSAKGGASR